MANTSGDTTTRPVSSPKYRPLRRSKNEFRLLKILPPTSPHKAGTGPLEFSQEPIRCELQYESFDVLANSHSAEQSSMNSIVAYLLQDIPRMRANDTETDVGFLMDLSSHKVRSMLSVDEDTKHEISLERNEALQELYKTSNRKLEVWCPEGIQFRSKSFEDWLSSWVWTPLSGNANHLEYKSLSYVALSYVWQDRAQVTLGVQNRELDLMVSASGMTMREALEFAAVSPEVIEGVCGRAGDLTGDTTEIILDGVPMLVGKNLEKALCTLREIPEISNGTRVWVDALCINQQDLQEKNFEVKRMGEIYRKADRVLSYLGEESDQSGHILEFMDAIGEVMQRAKNLVPIIRGFLRNVQDDMAFSMTKFLLRTYFSRIWIVQEIVLGGEKSIAICGPRRFMWANLLRCGKMLNTGMAAASWNYDSKLGTMQNEGGDEDYLTLAHLKNGITKLQMLRDAHIDCRREDEDEVDRHVPASSTLWFRIPSSNSATDSRDLIYGMMNLLPKKLTDLIHVDYASPNRFVDVMRTFAEAHITSTNSLHWILHRYYSPFLGHQDWPTWVPNLAQQFSSAHWDWTINLEGSACPNIPCITSFAVARDTRKHLLICRGMKLDIIHTATQNLVMYALLRKKSMIQVLADSMTIENAEHVHSTIEDLQRSTRKQQSLIIPEEYDEGALPTEKISTLPVANVHKYGSTEGLKAALNKCFDRFNVKLEGGQSIFSFPLNISDEDDETLNQILASREFETPMVRSFNMIRDLFADFKLWDTSFRDLFPIRAADVDPASFSAPKIEGNAMSLAHLFTTFGGYVGTCLGNVRPGDELFLLAGCSMPVLLKKSATVSGAYQLQGGVYIPGLMNGEALNGGDHPEDNFKTVLIC